MELEVFFTILLLASVVKVPLTVVFNLSLSAGVFPAI
jgi:hypothetical protein